MNKSESIIELTKALCKFHASVGKIKKSAENPFFKSKYADLSSILDVIEEPLHTNGLSFVQFPIGEHQMSTMLMHESGEWMEGTYTMKPTKNDPQGLGSVITYQRRYALGAILGLNIDVDDDGNAASQALKQKTTNVNEVDAVKEMQATKTKAEINVVWNKYPTLKATTTEFYKATSIQNGKIKE